MSEATSLAALLGPLADVLVEDDVVEISCNPSMDVFVERFGADPVLWGALDRPVVDRFIRWCASWSRFGLSETCPILSGRIPGCAHRIEALIPPVVEAPCFSIRRHSERVITLEEFLPDPLPRSRIADAIAAKQSILIAGATGAGKTTLLNACLLDLNRIAPATRLITIEDTPEIRSPLINTVPLRTCDALGMDRLLVSALRQAPDRIVVGEVREGRVLMTLIKAWNTGHPGGLVTLHANSAAEVLSRLRMLSAEVFETDMTPVLLASLDMVVFLRRGRAAPVVETIAVTESVTDGTPRMETVYEHATS